MPAPSPGRVGACTICDLPPEELLELDTMLADPQTWPRAVFGKLELPQGFLPPRMRLWGGTKLCQVWCNEHGHPVKRPTAYKHYREHVPIVVETVADIAGLAITEEAKDARTLSPGRNLPDVTVVNFRRFYSRGLELGERALSLVLAAIDKAEREDREVSMSTLLKVADLGARLATSAAAIEAKGFELARDREMELEGFRAGMDGLPSERMGDHRIRVVEGETRAVVDRGPADRAAYSARAREYGGPELPSP
jgi:hypothetical protein